MSVLIIENVEIMGSAARSVLITDGVITSLGSRHDGLGERIDGGGGALIPGLADHHIHLLATAARDASIDLTGARTSAGVAARLAAAQAPPGSWLRATGYHERDAGELDLATLDRIAPDHPLRVQHQSGAVWLLNTAALNIVAGTDVADADLPPCVERGPGGAPTGRIWRGDAWLGRRIGRSPPALAATGRQLARFGVTAVTDASATNDDAAAVLLAEARRSGALPQRLTLMSAGAIEPPPDQMFEVGPVKVLLDDDDLPPFELLTERIRTARRAGRNVAVHCVTDVQLALSFAAFAAAGAVSGDRIEHGGVVPISAIAELAQLGLTIVTQPGFIHDHGDRYLAALDPADHADLYRCASLQAGGVAVAGGSDAPYGSLDPWQAMRTAVHRLTQTGQRLGGEERIAPPAALALFTGMPAAPAVQRRVAAGQAADLCLLRLPVAAAFDVLHADIVAATFIAGDLVHRA